MFLKNIASIFLAFLLLFSTMSFTFNEHYCGDNLVDSTLFTKAETCGMETQKPSPEENCSIDKKNCCKDVVILIEGQDDLKLDFADLDLQHQVFITTFVFTYINLFEGLDKNIVPFKNYSPPLIVKDIHVLDNVFLI